MIEAILLSGWFATPPQLEWTERKRLLRERVVEAVQAGNSLYRRDDPLPRLLVERLSQQHAEFRHSSHRLVVDVESVQHPEKFWHVYHHSIAHEWAHYLNANLRDARGHDIAFATMQRTLQTALEWPQENRMNGRGKTFIAAAPGGGQ